MTVIHSTLEQNCYATPEDSREGIHAQPPNFKDATRIQRSVSAGLEGRVLVWLAQRIPARVNPDHLTLLGFVSMFLAGCSYALARWNSIGLMLATVCLVLNWFGDSLDGNLARVRNCQRPRYGFYVDHMIDSFGALFLMSGLAISGYVTGSVAVGMLAAFLMLSIELYLAAYTIGIFQLSFWKFGPTEIRILLGLANTALWLRGDFRVLGSSFRLFDIGGVIATAGMGVMLIAAVISHTKRLYFEETQPSTIDRSCTPPFSPSVDDSRTSKSTILRIMFSLIVFSALACAPKLAFAQHGGRGSRGSGGFHSDGSHGAGRGHYGGRSSRSGMSTVPKQTSGRSYGKSFGFASRPYSNSAYLGNHRAGLNDSRHINSTARTRLGMGSGVRFRSRATARNSGDAGSARPAARNFGNGAPGWHSFGSMSSRAPTARSYSSALGGWHSFEPQINRVGPATARDFAGSSRQWHSFGKEGNASVTSTVASMNFGSNRPTTLGLASRSWSGPGHSFWANAPRSTSFFSSPQGLSNFANSRYGNSALGHSSFSSSRIGSNVSLFTGSRFGAAHQLQLDAATFGRGNSLGGGGFSFAADLFSSLLGFGGFGLRGLDLLGSTFGRLPWDSFPWFGLGRLFSPESGSNAGSGLTYEAPYLYDRWGNWGTSGTPEISNIQAQGNYENPQCSTPYSTENPLGDY